MTEDKNYFKNEMETIKKLDHIIPVNCSYKITDKMETRYLKRCLTECRNIEKGEMALIGKCGMEIDYSQIITLFNLNIIEYMNHIFNYYNRNFGIEMQDTDWGNHNNEFSTEWRISKTIENNIAEICHTLKSWEE